MFWKAATLGNLRRATLTVSGRAQRTRGEAWP